MVEVEWRGRPRTLFFQDGPYFTLDTDPDTNPRTTLLATYPDGSAAALVTSFGAGRVAVAGPHPEATDDWFTDADLPLHRAATWISTW